MRVLIVDDHALFRRSLVRALRRVGTVLEASTLEEARGMADVDAVLTDLVLPSGSGLDLLRALAEEKPTVQRLLMSGGPDPEVDAAIAAGVVQRFFVKPIDVAEVVGMLMPASLQ